MRRLVAFAFLLLAACVTAEQKAASPLEFDGLLDLSRPGIGFVLSHSSALNCTGHLKSSLLPDKFFVPLTCSERLSGILDAVKSDRIEGIITLSNGQKGKVSIDTPFASSKANRGPAS